MGWLNATVLKDALLVTPPAQVFVVEEIGARSPTQLDLPIHQ